MSLEVVTYRPFNITMFTILVVYRCSSTAWWGPGHWKEIVYCILLLIFRLPSVVVLDVGSVDIILDVVKNRKLGKYIIFILQYSLKMFLQEKISCNLKHYACSVNKHFLMINFLGSVVITSIRIAALCSSSHIPDKIKICWAPVF